MRRHRVRRDEANQTSRDFKVDFRLTGRLVHPPFIDCTPPPVAQSLRQSTLIGAPVMDERCARVARKAGILSGIAMAVLLMTELAILLPRSAAQSNAQTPKSPVSGQRSPRLAIRNAMVVDGNGTPASGPKDIIVEGNTIAEVVSLDPISVREGRAKRP